MSFIVSKYRYIVKNSFELPLGLFMFSSLAHIKYTNTLEIHTLLLLLLLLLQLTLSGIVWLGSLCCVFLPYRFSLPGGLGFQFHKRGTFIWTFLLYKSEKFLLHALCLPWRTRKNSIQTVLQFVCV